MELVEHVNVNMPAAGSLMRTKSQIMPHVICVLNQLKQMSWHMFAFYDSQSKQGISSVKEDMSRDNSPSFFLYVMAVTFISVKMTELLNTRNMKQIVLVS
jgi:hypothetical protein